MRCVAERSGLGLEARNALIVDCGGRENLPAYVQFCASLGLAFLVVADGDTTKAVREPAVQRNVAAVRQAVVQSASGALFEFVEDVEHAFGLSTKGFDQLLDAVARAPLDEHAGTEASHLASELRKLIG